MLKTEIFAKKSFDRFVMRIFWWKNCGKMKGRSGRVQVSCDFGTLEYSRKVLCFSYAHALLVFFRFKHSPSELKVSCLRVK